MSRIDLSASPELFELLFTHSQVAELRTLGDLHVHLDPDRFADEVAEADLDVVITTWATPPMREWARSAPPRLLAHTGGTLRPLFGSGGPPPGCIAVQASAGMAGAVAEMSLAMCLLLLRQLHTLDRALQHGDGWREVADLHGRDITDQRIGVIGASRTGRAFLRMVRGMGAVELRVYDPYLSAAEVDTLGAQLSDLDGLLTWSDVLVVHAPVTPETIGMLGAPELAAIRDGGIVVNTARAALIDERALHAEAASGRLTFGLDVFHHEPLAADSPLIGLANVFLAPHRGAATTGARQRQGQIVVDEIARFRSGAPLQHAVAPENYHQLS